MSPGKNIEKINWSSMRTIFILIMFLIITFFIYSLGLSGPFILDDNTNIIEEKNIHIYNWNAESVKKLLPSRQDFLNRSVSMFSFALNFNLFGLDPYYFKLINILIHIFNGIAVFVLTYFLMCGYKKCIQPTFPDSQIKFLCLMVAGAWLLHPLSLTSVLYIVQRMNSLSAFFTLLGLIAYVIGRLRICQGKGGIAIIFFGFLVCFPLAILSKENGVLLPFFMLIIEFTLFRFCTNTIGQAWFLRILFFSTTVMPVCTAVLYTIVYPDWLVVDSYRMQEFSLYERLLSEPRVLWFYVGLILKPDISEMGLFHDDISVSTGILFPPITIIAIVGILVVFLFAIFLRKRCPIFSFGVLFFLIGHSLESTFIGLALGFEHRNYLPQYGLLLPLLYYLMRCFSLLRLIRVQQIFFPLYLTILATNTGIRANIWGGQVNYALVEAENHPNSAMANNMAGEALLYLMDEEGGEDSVVEERRLHHARIYFEKSVVQGNHFLGGLFNLWQLYGITGRSPSLEYYTELLSRLRAKPVAYSTTNYITFLSQCRKEKKCNISIQKMLNIFQTTLENPKLNRKHKILLTVDSAQFLHTQATDIHGAVKLLCSAIHQWPGEIYPRFALASLFMELQMWEEAYQHIEVIRSLDPLLVKKSTVVRLKKILEKKASKNEELFCDRL